MASALHARIRGQVQGVFFRAWTRDQADRLGLSGWVRNCDDGSVEAFFEGDAEALERITALLRQGPPAARVDELSCDAAEPQGLSGFTVRC